MDGNETGKAKSTFLKIFASVPDPLRDEIIVVIGEDPYTWRTANAEIEHNTDKSRAILKQLQRMAVI